MKFIKMHGIGNDYIYFDCLNNELSNPSEVSIKLSDRHFGIGGDGIVMICSSKIADAKMRMFNADGSEGKMCGNAIRCVGKYLYDYGIAKKEIIDIETLSGIKRLYINAENGIFKSAKVDMGKAILQPKLIPVNLSGDKIVNYPFEVGGNNYNLTCVSMGNPHCVVFYDGIDNMQLDKIGVQFEKNPIFPESVNTEFVEIISRNKVRMRVWERGSGETMACGTGACAVAVACVLNGYCDFNSDITVKLRGGDLVIRYTENAVFMTGGATKVFEGDINL